MLTLYTNFTPNNNNNIYYYFSSALNYFSSLATYKLKDIDLNNYRYNNNIIKVKKDILYLDNGNFDKVTYISIKESDSEGTFYRFFFVRNAFIESGYIVYNCSIDLWASYIYRASLNDIIVKRCNKLITGEVGIYNEISAVNNNIEFEGQTIINNDLDYLNIIIVLNYNLKQNLTSTDTVGRTQLFSFNLGTFKEKLATLGYEDLTPRKVLEYAIATVGGIYGVVGNTGDLDAQVIGCYILPRIYMSTEALNGITVKSTVIIEGTTQSNFAINLYTVKAYKTTVTNRTPTNFTPNKKYYYGAKYSDSLELNNFTTGVSVDITYITNIDNIQVLIHEGDNYKDVTSAFSVEITTNATTQTSLRKLASAFISTADITKSILKGSEKSGIVGGATAGVVGVGKDIARGILNTNINKPIGKGDALVNFIDDGTLKTPLCFNIYTSKIDEGKLARLNGVKYNCNIDSINTIDSLEFVGTGTFDINYIECEVAVSNIPLDAKEYIESVFNKGVYLEFV